MTEFAPNLKTGGTEWTEGTTVDLYSSERFPEQDSTENSGNLLQPVEPDVCGSAEIEETELNRPEFKTYDYGFTLDGKDYVPGLYHHAYAKIRASSEPEPIEK